MSIIITLNSSTTSISYYQCFIFALVNLTNHHFIYRASFQRYHPAKPNYLPSLLNITRCSSDINTRDRPSMFAFPSGIQCARSDTDAMVKKNTSTYTGSSMSSSGILSAPTSSMIRCDFIYYIFSKTIIAFSVHLIHSLKCV